MFKNTNSIAYESHYGSKQYWHSMSPSNNLTNQEVLDLIIKQARDWFSKGLTEKEGNGLFHVGKLLHTIQDSYSKSHVIRDESTNEVIGFQNYSEQDEKKHSEVDKDPNNKGVRDAQKASEWILQLYQGCGKDTPECIENLIRYLTNEVYLFKESSGNAKSGGTHEDYKKDKD